MPSRNAKRTEDRDAACNSLSLRRFLTLITSYHRVFLPVLTKAGIRKIRLHDLRHTFGSLLLQNGASIVYVKEQMGHSSIQVTVALTVT